MRFEVDLIHRMHLLKKVEEASLNLVHFGKVDLQLFIVSFYPCAASKLGQLLSCKSCSYASLVAI